MQPATGQEPINEEKLHAFLGRVVGDFGAALSSALVYIGQKLGLYKAMAGAGGLTPAELALKTGTVERYVREWLINQAASGYVEYDPDLFVGTERFFRPGYTAHLVSTWIPALTGIENKLASGAKVADVGCGHGASAMIMARAFPNSKFFGYDNHAPSIEHARRAAADAGLSDRVIFEVASAGAIPDEQYDLIAFFDCLHDMGDPVGAVTRANDTLAVDGSLLIVEPMAGNTVEENFNPIGRTFSAASTLCCTANSLALGGPGLGAVATEDALRGTVMAGGFTQFRRATETPFNRVFEARR